MYGLRGQSNLSRIIIIFFFLQKWGLDKYANVTYENNHTNKHPRDFFFDGGTKCFYVHEIEIDTILIKSFRVAIYMFQNKTIHSGLKEKEPKSMTCKKTGV